jgi:protein-disulfide isomerase
VHRHHVDIYDELGLRAAELSTAAQDAGRFWDFHDRLMSRDGPLTEAALTEIAASMGIDAPPADALARVKQHLDAGVKAGVERLPIVFVNGRYFSGTFSYDQLRAMVAEELEAAGRSNEKPPGGD